MLNPGSGSSSSSSNSLLVLGAWQKNELPRVIAEPSEVPHDQDGPGLKKSVMCSQPRSPLFPVACT